VNTPAITARAERLARVITAALLLLGMEREVVAGDDTVTIGDIIVQWVEGWSELRSGGERRTSGQAGWEVRILPSALPSGILHNAHSAVQQVIVLTVLEQIQGALADPDAPRSASVDGA